MLQGHSAVCVLLQLCLSEYSFDYSVGEHVDGLRLFYCSFPFFLSEISNVLWACGVLMMALRQRFIQRVSQLISHKWIVSSAPCCFSSFIESLDHFSEFEHNNNVFLQMPGADGVYCLLSCSRSCLFHPKMRTGHLSGWRHLLPAGKQHYRLHLLQAIRGQDLLQHRHGHPQTFRGAYPVASVCCGILCPASVVFKIQAAHPDTQRTPSCYHITRSAHAERHTGRFDGPGSCRTAALIRWMQTPADLWRNCAGLQQGTAGVKHGADYMTRTSVGWIWGFLAKYIRHLRLYFISL